MRYVTDPLSILVCFAVVAQLVEHVIGNDEVSGSIPDVGSQEDREGQIGSLVGDSFFRPPK